MLQFDWEEVEGEAVAGIIGRSARKLNDGTLCWTAVALIVGDRAVTVIVDPDTDELSVSLGLPPAAGDWAPIPALANNLGKELGWCWIGRNYRGYLDAFTIGFAGVDPGCMFVGQASTIVIKNLVAIGAA